MKLTQKYFNNKLRELGPELLSDKYREDWTKDNPTYGYCYIVSEMLHHYEFNYSAPYFINLSYFVEEEHDVHWFLKVERKLYDFTGNQYDFKIPYAWATRGTFYDGSVQAPKGLISERGYELAKHFNYVE